MRSVRRLPPLAACALLVASAPPTAAARQRADPPVPNDPPASVSPGINDTFLAPDLDPAEWAGRFEAESREPFAARHAVVAVLGIEEGDAVADIGAGTGAHLHPFAGAVGEGGRVYAVDLAPAFVARLRDRAAADRLPQVTPVLCSATDVMLPAGSCDLVFSSDAYHHFEFPDRTLASILKALKPGGRLAVLDFERVPGVSSDWVLGHVRAGKQTVRAEIEAAGFEFLAEPDVPGLEENYLLLFRKPAVTPGATPDRESR